MKNQNPRLEAAKLARQLDAPKTLAVLNDDNKNSSIDVILKSALDEVGLDKLVSVILESDHPFWAIGALRYLSNLGKYESALKEKARIVFLSPNDGAKKESKTTGFASGIPSINTFEMYIACGAGYVASFTLWYFTPPFSNHWNKNTVTSGRKKPVCQSSTKVCSFFSMDKAPLKDGDTVMMVLDIAGNKDWVPTNIWFRYNPDAHYTAEIDCHGQTLNSSFTHSVKTN